MWLCVGWVELRDIVLQLGRQGEAEDLDTTPEELGSMIHDDGDPEPPSVYACRKNKQSTVIIQCNLKVIC